MNVLKFPKGKPQSHGRKSVVRGLLSGRKVRLVGSVQIYPPTSGRILINSTRVSGSSVMTASGSRMRWSLITIIYSLAAKACSARARSSCAVPGVRAFGSPVRINTSGDRYSPHNPGRWCAAYSATSWLTLCAMRSRTVVVAEGNVTEVC